MNKEGTPIDRPKDKKFDDDVQGLEMTKKDYMCQEKKEQEGGLDSMEECVDESIRRLEN